MKYLSFDLETIPQDAESYSKAQKRQFDIKRASTSENFSDDGIRSTDPTLGRILCIGIYYVNTDSTPVERNSMCIYKGTEKDILESFWEGVESLPHGTKLVSFNGLRFDVPWVRLRSLANNIKIPKCKVDFFNVNQFHGSPHVDLMVSLKGDKFLPNITLGLGLACEIFGIPSPKDGGIDGSEVYEFYKNGKIDEIASYAERDTESTGLLYEKLLDLNYGV